VAQLHRVITGGKPPTLIDPKEATSTIGQQPSTFELKPHQVQAVKLLGSATLTSHLV
jgi:hypothetical protein